MSTSAVSPRQEIIERISTMQRVVATTQSPFLRKDYQKGIKRLQRELAFYDKNHTKCSNR